MLIVLQPGKEPMAEAIFHKWELDFAVIGEVTDTGRMELVWQGETVCDIPLGPLADDAPLYDRPHVPTPSPAPLRDVPECSDVAADLLRLMASPDLASRRWIWEQYDSQVGADTMQKPGGDAAVVRIHGTNKALAMSTDCTPRYCFADPYEGGKQAIAECYRNLCAVGATPLAVTNCLNFANPQRPEIMGQIVGCLEGMGDACRALDFPIVSGNVSLYNESKATGGGSAILPTPAIGGVGVLEDHAVMVTIAFKREGETIVLLGGDGSHLGQLLWLRELHGREDGPPPPVDLTAERIAGEFVRALIAEAAVSAVHDCADGGLAVALAEMAIAGNMGFTAEIAANQQLLAGLCFGEDQGRYLVTTLDPAAIVVRARELGIRAAAIGAIGGADCAFRLGESGRFSSVPLAAIRAAHESFFRNWMED